MQKISLTPNSSSFSRNRSDRFVETFRVSPEFSAESRRFSVPKKQAGTQNENSRWTRPLPPPRAVTHSTPKPLSPSSVYTPRPKPAGSHRQAIVLDGRLNPATGPNSHQSPQPLRVSPHDRMRTRQHETDRQTAFQVGTAQTLWRESMADGQRAGRSQLSPC